MNEENQIIFERYLNNALTAEEETTFLARLEVDKTFKQDFELYKEMNGFLEEQVRHHDALDVLRDVHKEETSIPELVPKRKTYWVWALIVVALLILTFYGYSVIKQTQRVNKIMAMYEFPPNSGVRSADMAQTKLDSAIWYFDLRDFDKSKKRFLDILEQDSTHQEANRYMGHIMFLEKEFDTSLEFFNKVNGKNRFDSMTISLLLDLQ